MTSIIDEGYESIVCIGWTLWAAISLRLEEEQQIIRRARLFAVEPGCSQYSHVLGAYVLI